MGTSVLFATRSGCPFLPGVDRSSAGYGCDRSYRTQLARAQAPGVNRVVIGSFWQGYLSSPEPGSYPSLQARGTELSEEVLEEVLAELAADLTTLVSSGKEVVLIGPHPTSTDFDPMRIARRSRSPFARVGAPTDLPDLSQLLFLEESGWLISALREVADLGGALFIDPVAYLCDGEICSSSDEGVPRYKDGDHLRPFAVIRHLSYVPSLVLAEQRRQE